MDQFGVTSPRLKSIARRPEFPTVEKPRTSPGQRLRDWKGAMLRDLEEMEFSALQISESDTGVIVAACPADTAAYKMGMRSKDFIQSVDGRAVKNVGDFFSSMQPLASGKKVKVKLLRARQEVTMDMGVDGKERDKP